MLEKVLYCGDVKVQLELQLKRVRVGLLHEEGAEAEQTQQACACN